MAVEPGDEFGFAVASEGSRMVVGAPSHDGKGAVFVYSYDGAAWNLDSTIIPNQVQPGDKFGYSVSLSGGLLAVGARDDDTAGPDAGAAYVFLEVASGQWAIQEKLLPSVPQIFFGDSLSLWDDTVAVGAPTELESRVYVFRQSGTTWLEEGDTDGPPFEQPVPGATSSSFGESVGLYQDTLLVGDDDYFKPSEPNGFNPGIAHVYKRVGSTWALVQSIANPSGDSDGEHFGEAVTLHGRWAAIGAPQEDPLGVNNQGVVYLYKTDATGAYPMFPTQTLVGSTSIEAEKFGSSVATRSGVLVVGAPTKVVAGLLDAGGAYQFNLVSGLWVEAGEYVRDLGDVVQFDRFGRSAAIGTYSVVGAPSDASGAFGTGRTYVWSLCQ